MKYVNTIAPRHRIEKTDGEVNITINSRRNLSSILFLTLWIFMWTYMVSGLSTVVWAMFSIATGKIDPDYQAPPILVVALCAFTIFFLLALFLGAFGIYRFLWELAGKEFIIVTKEKMILARQLFGWKSTRELSNRKIDELIIRNTKQSLFWNPFQNRYRYAFELNYDGKTHRFGYSVKEREAKEILMAIQEFIFANR